MEYLDIYDENGNYIGKETRENVHKNALWHKTVHCWLYDKEGNVYFQIRADVNKLYTTASGHIKAGETVKQGFAREIKEEIGIDVNYEKAELVNVYTFTMNKQKSDGSMFRDRAFSNVYVCEYNGNGKDFNFDQNEVTGLVKVNAQDTLDLINGTKQSISSTVYKNINNTVKYIYKKSMKHKNFNKKSKNILFFQRKEMLIISLVNEARRKSKNRRTCNYE